jgi:hypothetical protein
MRQWRNQSQISAAQPLKTTFQFIRLFIQIYRKGQYLETVHNSCARLVSNW